MRRQRTRMWRLPKGIIGRSGTRLATLVLMLVTLSLLVSFGEQVVQGARMERQRQDLASEVEQLQREGQRLAAAADYAESDVYADRRAREMLSMAREGDVVILPQLPPLASLLEPAPLAIPTPAREPNWLRWWQAFSRQ